MARTITIALRIESASRPPWPVSMPARRSAHLVAAVMFDLLNVLLADLIE